MGLSSRTPELCQNGCTDRLVFTERRYASEVYAVAVCMFVCVLHRVLYHGSTQDDANSALW